MTSSNEPTYGGFTRFELELEFVQLLGNPWYLNHLASHNMFDKPEFIAYLDYLQYWRQPEYAKFLSYPGPALRALELVQQEKFRADIVKPQVMMNLIEENLKVFAKKS